MSNRVGFNFEFMIDLKNYTFDDQSSIGNFKKDEIFPHFVRDTGLPNFDHIIETVSGASLQNYPDGKKKSVFSVD